MQALHLSGLISNGESGPSILLSWWPLLKSSTAATLAYNRGIKGVRHAKFRIFLKIPNMSYLQLNSKNNGIGLVFNTIL